MKTVDDFRLDAGGVRDGRLDAPAFHRNGMVLREVVTKLLGSRTGNVVEIGSGTGQHAGLLSSALPDIRYWPTDPDESHVASIDAWRGHGGGDNLMPATQLDVRENPWRLAGQPVQDRSLTAILCFNVIHIAPWDVALALLNSAGKLLAPDGYLILYGPYSRNGMHTAPSNAAFDQSLKSRDPEWGVRDLEDVTTGARKAGLERHAIFEMPANNLTVVFGSLTSPSHATTQRIVLSPQ